MNIDLTNKDDLLVELACSDGVSVWMYKPLAIQISVIRDVIIDTCTDSVSVPFKSDVVQNYLRYIIDKFGTVCRLKTVDEKIDLIKIADYMGIKMDSSMDSFSVMSDAIFGCSFNTKWDVFSLYATKHKLDMYKPDGAVKVLEGLRKVLEPEQN